MMMSWFLASNVSREKQDMNVMGRAANLNTDETAGL
jgi:hypothetical protein